MLFRPFERVVMANHASRDAQSWSCAKTSGLRSAAPYLKRQAPKFDSVSIVPWRIRTTSSSLSFGSV